MSTDINNTLVHYKIQNNVITISKRATKSVIQRHHKGIQSVFYNLYIIVFKSRPPNCVYKVDKLKGNKLDMQIRKGLR